MYVLPLTIPKLEVGAGAGIKGESTSSTVETPNAVSRRMRTMYLFPRGLVVKFTSTVFSFFLQAVMFGSHRLPAS